MKRAKKPKDFVKAAEFHGSRSDLENFINENLVYPPPAIQHRTEGTVIVAYAINERGRVVQARVVHGIGDGCDEEALRLVNLLQFKPVKNRHMRTTTNKRIGIKFQLQKQESPVVSYSYQPDASPLPAATASPPDDVESPATTYQYVLTISPTADQ